MTKNLIRHGREAWCKWYSASFCFFRGFRPGWVQSFQGQNERVRHGRVANSPHLTSPHLTDRSVVARFSSRKAQRAKKERKSGSGRLEAREAKKRHGASHHTTSLQSSSIRFQLGKVCIKGGTIPRLHNNTHHFNLRTQRSSR